MPLHRSAGLNCVFRGHQARHAGRQARAWSGLCVADGETAARLIHDKIGRNLSRFVSISTSCDTQFAGSSHNSWTGPSPQDSLPL